jgi:hypothetical protein
MLVQVLYNLPMTYSYTPSLLNSYIQRIVLKSGHMPINIVLIQFTKGSHSILPNSQKM